MSFELALLLILACDQSIWIVLPYVRYSVWLSMPDAFDHMHKKITENPSTSDPPFWQHILESTFGGAEQITLALWFMGTWITTAVSHYLFLGIILDPKRELINRSNTENVKVRLKRLFYQWPFLFLRSTTEKKGACGRHLH